MYGVCRSAEAELALQRLDLVLADRPIPPTVSTLDYGHTPGESAISIHAKKKLMMKLTGGFPHCLDGAPLLLDTLHPTRSSYTHRERSFF